MATIIPPVIADYKYDGERNVALKIKKDSKAKDWIVLHSLDVSKHISQVVGECDFVIIIPGKGVLCLEVKGCKSLAVDKGLWHYGKKSKGDKRGPFKQAADNMHSIRNYLTNLNFDLGKVIFWSAVIFPFISFKRKSLEWNDWQVIDSDNFNARPVSQLFSNVLDQARLLLKKKTGMNWFDPSFNGPDNGLCSVIKDILRPEFEYYQSPSSRRKKLSESLKKYTSEQFVALDAMQTNAMVVFNGPAGTGKTLLAIETARRSMLEGKKVLFLCFNKNISIWIKRQFEQEDLEKITISTLHALMLKVSGLKMESNPSSDFWSKTLPEAAIEKILNSDGTDVEAYDFLVLDEAQDVLRDEYLDFIDLLLKKDLSDGYWKIFGDFDNQQIYSASDIKLMDFITHRCQGTPVYTLGINCRNTPRIAEYAHLLGGLDPEYQNILRPDDKVKPELKFYDNDDEQADILANLLDRFRTKDKYKNEEIVILSPISNSCCSKKLKPPWDKRVAVYSPEESVHNKISYCTIHAFKGLETPVVIVTDMDRIQHIETINLLYISITRTLSKLVILLNNSARDDLKQILGV
ncbi:NERD domain-containing protein/DEAD/DEAH box helicase [Desulfobacula sp.]|uniref:nuclease-related domain-containing DEAD/DEAH box helicase n=1 Tax=Desulfobacula sp. TaxID=2593537 RepID=UPI0025BC6B40|nr:NERD domain-containing protein/DEAD/DEAH box helicase [Desulfobacula sp.]MBC2705604.1 NERD domain-containing protein/DEAD/DEAH box helicase [Desulfobacula sp.]